MVALRLESRIVDQLVNGARWPAVVRDVASESDAVVRVRAAPRRLSTTRRADAHQTTAP